MKAILTGLYRFLASNALACVLFLLLALLTLLGTLEQASIGLYDTQRKYFDSLFVVHWIGDRFPVPLPGVFLLLLILSVNLVLGGLVRIRRRWSKIGIFITHAGIAFLLLAGFVPFRWAQEGYMTLFEGEEAGVFRSHHSWELVIVDKNDPRTDREHIIPVSEVRHTASGGQQVFHSGELPFDLIVDSYARNSRLREVAPAGGGDRSSMTVVPLRPEKENERNIPAVRVTLVERGVDTPAQQGWVWGLSRNPLLASGGGGLYQVYLRKVQWPLPFAIELTKFTREVHPGTNTPKAFSSDVILKDAGVEQDIRISMNEPLRHRGYTFYQSSFSQDDQTGMTSSTFSVVRNPAEQLPAYACLVITLGMLIQFGNTLVRYIRKERTRTA